MRILYTSVSTNVVHCHMMTSDSRAIFVVFCEGRISSYAGVDSSFFAMKAAKRQFIFVLIDIVVIF